MAAKVLKEQLRCTICFGIYTDPKILHCLHVYCQQCLVPLVARDEQGPPGIACPTCHQITPIPEGGVAELPSALHINRLLEIQESASISTRELCPKHAGEELKLYCETCKECAIQGMGHGGHQYSDLNQKRQQKVTSSLGPMKKHIKDTKKVLEQERMASMTIDYPYLASVDVSVDASVSSLFSHHQVKEEDADKQVSDKHLDEISRTCCRKWKSLRPHLEMEEIVEHNIGRGPGDEEEKRRSFFFQWKDVMGSAATYKMLICALLKINCREDAECVCKLLAQSQGSQETGEHERAWPAMLSSGMSIS